MDRDRRLIFKGKKHLNLDQSEANTNDIQEDPKNHGKCMVEVKNVYKIYQSLWDGLSFKKNKNEGQKYAVENVSFKVYENEIFGILGHNGAGKTTLIRTMIGALKSDYGNILYEGADLKSNLRAIHKKFGICSQNNIFFENLTVEENIIIFSKLKNIDINLEEILEDVDLTVKRYSKVTKLSGGQKRKLCISLALMGNPKYVFLDEPTTGLDPLSRRKIWEFLLKRKRDCVIFLTTHYMDEADILADRKLIMSKGKIRCLGTSVYLKNHFETTYSLNVETNAKNEVDSIITKHIPEATYFYNKTEVEKITNQSNTTFDNINSYTWKLPISETAKYSELLKELDIINKNNNELVKNYSLSMPSLEELFIYLEDNNNDKYNKVNKNNFAENSELILKKSESIPVLKPIPKPSSLQTILCLIKYRLKIFTKRKTFFILAILLPILFLSGIFPLYKLLIDNRRIDYQSKTLSSFEMYTGNLWNYDIMNSSMNKTINKGNIEKEFPVLSENKYAVEFSSTEEMNEKGKNIFQKPYYVASFSGEHNNNNLNLNVFYNDSMSHSLPVTLNSLSNAILSSYNVQQRITMNSHPFSENSVISNLSISNFASIFICVSLCLEISFFGPLTVHERVNNLLKRLQLNCTSRINYWLATFSTDFTLLVVFAFVIILCGAISGIEAFQDINILLVLCISILVWCAASIIVQYYLSFYFRNTHYSFMLFLILNLVPSISFMSLINIANKITMNNSPVFSMSMDVILINFLITLIYPIYGMYPILHSLLSLSNFITSKKAEVTLSQLLVYNTGVITQLISLVISLVIYTYLKIRKDNKKNRFNVENKKRPMENIEKNDKILSESDSDVINEFHHVNDNNFNIPIKIVRLGVEYKVKNIKTYNEMIKGIRNKNPKFGEVHTSDYGGGRLIVTSLEDVTFGVDRHECFGLLGPNGAGKSSLIKTAAFCVPQTVGDLYYNEKKNNSIKERDFCLGYCPQDDILWKELTLFEHLVMYLNFRGYNNKDSVLYAKQYIKCCHLEDHKHKLPSELSGGTRRKLSLLLALCCTPEQIMLDEPTSGMDPSTRRYIWNFIKKNIQNNNSSIILTTHSMEEAEILCNRIGILVNGRLKCLGSPEHLKMKFGDKYTVEVQSDQIEVFHDTMMNHPNLLNHDMTYERVSGNRAKYEIKIAFGLGKIFEMMEEYKAQNLITDYGISQTSLEDIFISFAKQQLNHELY